MNSFGRKCAAAFIALVAVIACGTGTRADVLGQGTTIDPFDTFSEDPVPIPLNAKGGTAVTFKTRNPDTLVVVTYNAECAVLGPPSSRLSIEIQIDGVSMHPRSGTNFALCAATNGTNKVYASVSRQAVLTVPEAGSHKVRVIGVLPDGATFASVDDSSLVIQD